MKRLLTFFLTLAITSVSSSMGSTPSADPQEHALRIEYNLIVPQYDSLINYLHLPYKKILTIHKGEALLESYSADYLVGLKTYYDLTFNFYYRGFENYSYSGQLSKKKWIKRGRVMATSKQAAHDVLGVPCKAIQVRNDLEGAKDTLLVYATDKYGLDFFELGEIDGLALEYEIEYEKIGKIKYRAVKIDSILLYSGRLANLPTFNAREVDSQYKKLKRLDDRNKRHLERTRQKMIGTKAPFFRARDLDDNLVRSKKLKGKIMVLHFWSGLVPSSLSEFSYLNKVVEKYEDTDEVAFVSFANLDRFSVMMATSEFPLKYTKCYSGHDAAAVYKCPVYPVHVVVDRKGKIVEYLYGAHPDIAKQLIRAVENLRR